MAPETRKKSRLQKREPFNERTEMVGARIPVSLSRKIDKYCKTHDVRKSDVFNTALRRFFDADNDLESTIAKQLTRQDRRLRLIDEKIDTLADMHLLSQRYFFAYHRPYVSDTEREQAQRFSQEAYAKYQSVLKEYMMEGGLFQELQTIVAKERDASEVETEEGGEQ